MLEQKLRTEAFSCHFATRKISTFKVILSKTVILHLISLNLLLEFHKNVTLEQQMSSMRHTITTTTSTINIILFVYAFKNGDLLTFMK